VILQSAVKSRAARRTHDRDFEIAVLANLRSVKDPLRAARAARLLPPDSRIRIVHAGAALGPREAARARAEMRRNRRYRWLGSVAPAAARRLLRRARALVLSSRLEGGANVISEAIVDGIPVLASRIPGSIGLLGDAYPGYFETGDTRGLAQLLQQFEGDATFRRRLQRAVARLAPRFTPACERAAWKSLLARLP
jgi:glycosyltransferase involved in cell wall biosynthesis